MRVPERDDRVRATANEDLTLVFSDPPTLRLSHSSLILWTTFVIYGVKILPVA